MVLFSAVTIPNVAATGTSVTIVSSPSQIPIGPDGNASLDVTARVTVTGWPPVSTSQMDASESNLLLVILAYANEGSSQTSRKPVLPGSVRVSPDACLDNSMTGLSSGYTICAIAPSCQFVAVSCPAVATEMVTFHATLTSAQSGNYSMRVVAALIFSTVDTPFGPQLGGPRGSSWTVLTSTSM